MKKLVGTYIFILLNFYSYIPKHGKKIYMIKMKMSFFDLKESFDNYRNSIPYSKGNGYNPYLRKIDLVKRVNEKGFFLHMYYGKSG